MEEDRNKARNERNSKNKIDFERENN